MAKTITKTSSAEKPENPLHSSGYFENFQELKEYSLFLDADLGKSNGHI